MKIINPHFKINEGCNIFDIRKKEYYNIEFLIAESLKPVFDLGYDISKFGVVNINRYQVEELSKTCKKKFELILTKGEAKIDLSMGIPELLDDNFIFVNGKRKIPHFQLIDLPITTKQNKPIENSYIIKFRSNICTIVLYERFKKFPSYQVSLMGKRLPFALLLMAYYGSEKINEIFHIEEYENNQGLGSLDNLSYHMYGRLLIDIKHFYDMKLQHDDYLKLLGEFFTRYNMKVKGEEIIYGLNLIPQIDVITKRLMKKETVIDEIIDAIQNGPYDDLDLKNKRVRCFEYLIFSPFTRAIFNLCIATKNSKNPKFNVNSNEIIQNCNVSDIVQFDFSINPVDSLTELSRTSLLGPGGFKRKNVPKHLRDINDSMLGRLCVVDTPDRDNCGVVSNLLPNTKLDENFKFTEDVLKDQPVSAPVSMVPFLEHDDPTRLQMASSQMRQAILLRQPELPLIQSGCESLYSQNTPFVRIAKKDGIVLYRDNDEEFKDGDNFIIVQYDDGEIELIKAGCKKIYVNNMDMMEIYVKEGDKFKKGDVLAESLFVKNGIINIGRNLLTGITVYYGYNYEDGIVISEKLVDEGILSSVHFKDLSFFVPTNKILLTLYNYIDDPNPPIIEYDENGKARHRKRRYKPVPDVDDVINPGDPYAVLKRIPQKNSYNDHNILFEEDEILTTSKKIKILESNIYVNDYDKNKESLPAEYTEWIEEKLEKQKSKETRLATIINQYLPKEQARKFVKTNLSRFTSEGKYKIKGERIEGMFINLTGYYIRNIEVGDKVGNRHGNKGVISRILPVEKMPRLADGRSLDIIINPLGIISRMNIGQLFEVHLSMSLHDLKRNLRILIDKKIDQRKIKTYLLKYIKILDNTKGRWYSSQFKIGLKGIRIDEKFIDELSIIQPPFESVTMKKCQRAMNYTKTPFRYPLFDPCINEGKGDNLINEIVCGYMYFFRMVHIAEEKLAARGIGSYTKKTLQPTSGKRNQGGQRLGEMETACLIAHGSKYNLHESMTTKSDCIEAKNRWMFDVVDTGNKLRSVEPKNDEIGESVRLLNSYLTVIGINKDSLND